jgi:hypothetical protein
LPISTKNRTTPDKMLFSKNLTILFSLGCGIIASFLSLELLMQLLPVKTDRQFAANNITQPVIRGTVSSIIEPIDWKFSQTHRRRINNYGFVDEHNYQPNSAPVAVIGDSYVQSGMLPYQDTLQGKLSSKIGNKVPVYSFGTPIYPLSGYLGTAEYVDRVFKPRAYIFVLTQGDLIDSLKPQEGTYFLDNPHGKLRFKDAKVSGIKRLANNSALFRYMYQQIYFNHENIFPQQLNHNPSGKSKPTIATYEQISRRLLDLFGSKTKVRPQNTIFIIDSDRKSMYDRSIPDRDELSTFKRIGIERGYQVVDTQDLFNNYYQRTQKKLDFLPTDFHWNASAHQLVVDRTYPILLNVLTKPVK